MEQAQRSILLLGESNVGKTHYGAQVLKRLIIGQSSLKMHGQATNLGPFEHVMDSLADGRAAGHTPSNTYMESSWPVAHSSGRQAELIWPDYGGEQIKNLLSTHRIAAAWRDRVLAATNWILLVRPHTLKGNEDIFSRPLADLGTSNTEGAKYKPSDQARLIELLQILLHISGVSREGGMSKPTLTVLLSCWDELEAKAVPLEVLRSNLPMFCDFIESVWKQPIIIGLSALGRPLSEEQSDTEYSTRGPESFGYVVLPDGIEDKDITWPIARLFATN